MEYGHGLKRYLVFGFRLRLGRRSNGFGGFDPSPWTHEPWAYPMSMGLEEKEDNLFIYSWHKGYVALEGMWLADCEANMTHTA